MLNYVLVSTYLLAILVERTSLQANRTSTTVRYSQHRQFSWSVMAHAGICQHGRASHLSTTCPSTLGRSIHTNIIIIHTVQTSAPLIPKSKIIDSIKMANLWVSRRLGGPGLTRRTSARTLVEARVALRMSTSHLCYRCFLCRIHFYCDVSKITSN